ncbi:MAG: uracil-DNA glycosylase [Helicobacteraceae bacterium]|jgi:hypothetical protein|nr:uracil-DNA glycosylase [Helicobacteraceae bacterium]
MERIDCRKCRYFRITWENAFPYACDLFGFKGKQTPNVAVFANDGYPCRGFTPKNPNDGERKNERGFRA